MFYVNHCYCIQEAERNAALVDSIFNDAPQGRLTGVPIELGELMDNVINKLGDYKILPDGTYLFNYQLKNVKVRFNRKNILSSKRVTYIETFYYGVPISAFTKPYTDEYLDAYKRHFLLEGRSGEQYHLYAVAASGGTNVSLSNYAIR